VYALYIFSCAEPCDSICREVKSPIPEPGFMHLHRSEEVFAFKPQVKIAINGREED